MTSGLPLSSYLTLCSSQPPKQSSLFLEACALAALPVWDALLPEFCKTGLFLRSIFKSQLPKEALVAARSERITPSRGHSP